MWGELTSRHCDEDAHFTYYSSVIVESSLLYFMCDNGRIQEYDLESRSLNVFDGPDRRKRSNLVLAEDGGLGLIQDFDPQLKLWSRVKSDGTDARWVLSRVIILENLLQNGALQEGSVHVLGFAEGANVIFVTTPVGLFTIELQSQRVRRVCDDHGFCNLIPVVGFYIPVHGGEHQPLSSPSEEAGGEKGEEEEKTIDQAQQLLDKGSNVIKEGGFVNAFECVSHDLNIRVPRYGEGALEGASMLNKHGCALVSKDSWGDDPKSAGNEELVKRTSSKDDVKNSLTSGSNFDSAPSSEKDLEQRILKQQDAEERKRQLKENKKEKKMVSERAGLPEWS
uniref:Uncharacterized protein n=1 Tax=Avena sativa TaxID=4498 RepID=A0ACD6AA31_AVESA